MKIKYFLFALILTILIGSQISAVSAQALNLSNVNGFINQTGETAGIKSETSLTGLAAKIIQVLLGLVGIVFVIMIIYGGFLYLTSMGEEGKVKKAKDLLKLAILGFFIILAAYSITYFVASTLESSMK